MEFLQTLLDSLTGLLAAYPLAGEWYMAFVRFLFPALAVLILLNTYPLITSENLTFRSKQSSLQGSVSVMVTALSGLEELSEENVAGAMTLVEETGISRVLVTDASGRVLYDTRETDGAIGRYAFYTELVQALRGEDVFYTEFSDKAFKSRAASPVIYHSQTIVYSKFENKYVNQPTSHRF